jgi:hypothetical protein
MYQSRTTESVGFRCVSVVGDDVSSSACISLAFTLQCLFLMPGISDGIIRFLERFLIQGEALVLTLAFVSLLIMPTCLLNRVLRMSLQGFEEKPVHRPVLK